MKIETFLSPDDTHVDIVAADKHRLIQDLARRAASRLNIEAKQIVDEILKREGLGSTGMGAGIAIPHAQLSDVRKPFGLLARLKRPIDFDSIDGAPVDLVFLLLQPASPPGELNALASVARKLREPDRLARMRKADDSTALFAEMIR
jgi:PTS system nitrogen regulatory IIA component